MFFQVSLSQYQDRLQPQVSVRVFFMSSLECINLCASFSTPSIHRYNPPITSNTTINHCKNALINNADGPKISLFRKEPFATAHTTGNFRVAPPQRFVRHSVLSHLPTRQQFFCGNFRQNSRVIQKIMAITSIRASKLAASMMFPYYNIYLLLFFPKLGDQSTGEMGAWGMGFNSALG